MQIYQGGIAMAVRRAKIKESLDSKLQKVNNEILEAEERLKSLKEQKKELEAQKEQEELMEIRRLIHDSGKSMEDVKKFLMSEN